jgi:hypothetical protein
MQIPPQTPPLKDGLIKKSMFDFLYWLAVGVSFTALIILLFGFFIFDLSLYNILNPSSYTVIETEIVTLSKGLISIIVSAVLFFGSYYGVVYFCKRGGWWQKIK